MKITVFTTLLTSVLFLASCASNSGQRGGRGLGKAKGERFTQMDTSGDGRVDYSEFQQGPVGKRGGDAQTVFNRLDSNNDGYLTKEELRAGGRGKRPKPTS